MGNYYRNKINRWRSKMVKRRLAAGQGPDDYEFGMAATEAEKADATIATLTAERDAQDAKVRELVDAVLKERDLQAQSNGYISCAIDDVYELAQTLAAQLKETSNE